MIAYVISILLALGTPGADGDDEAVARAAAYLLGAQSPEDLDQGAAEETERLSRFLSNPVEINFWNRSRLVSSGLFTPYQAASLIDYRAENGDILSVMELAMVNGFNTEFAGVIEPFLSFSSVAAPGSSRTGGKLSNSAASKFSWRGEDISYGAKYRIDYDDSYNFALSMKSGDGGVPETYSLSAGYYGKKWLGKLLVGDFNAKFGQGLCIWTGFSMSGVSSTGSLARRASGLGQYGGYSPSYALRGLAAELDFGRFTLSAFGTIPLTGFKKYEGGGNSDLGLNFGYVGLKGQVSFSTLLTGRSVFEKDLTVRPVQGVKVSLDGRYNVRGVDLFGEACFDLLSKAPAIVAGTSFKAGENLRLGGLVKYFSPTFGTFLTGAVRSGTKCSDERSVSLAADFGAGDWVTLSGRSGMGSSRRRHTLEASADFAVLKPSADGSGRHRQTKIQSSYSVVLHPSWISTTKASLKMRNYGDTLRIDIKEDLRYDGGLVNASAKATFAAGRSGSCSPARFSSFAFSLDGGVKYEILDRIRLSALLRAGFFLVDSWPGRIYIYEYDAPGNFNVPALYGRGYWLSAYAALKIKGRWGLNLRAATFRYPFRNYTKDPKTEFRIQLTYDINAYLRGKS